MKKIGIIINPHAKKNRRMKVNPVHLYRELGSDFVDVRATQSLDEVFHVAEEFQKAGVDYLGICGGDGTVHHVISRFHQVYKNSALPPVVLLKGGTMDTVSRTISLKGKGPEILTRLIDLLKKGQFPKLYTRDTILVEDKIGFLFGLGITSNFLREYYRGGDTGPVKAVKVAVGGIVKGIFNRNNEGLFERYNLRVVVDGKELWFNNFLGVLAATVESVGIGFKPLYRALEKDNTFHVIATGIRPYRLALQVLRIKSGKPLRDRNHFDDIASEIRALGQGKIQYMIDGDLYEVMGELKVQAGPRIQLVYV